MHLQIIVQQISWANFLAELPCIFQNISPQSSKQWFNGWVFRWLVEIHSAVSWSSPDCLHADFPTTYGYQNHTSYKTNLFCWTSSHLELEQHISLKSVNELLAICTDISRLLHKNVDRLRWNTTRLHYWHNGVSKSTLPAQFLAPEQEFSMN